MEAKIRPLSEELIHDALVRLNQLVSSSDIRWSSFWKRGSIRARPHGVDKDYLLIYTSTLGPFPREMEDVVSLCVSDFNTRKVRPRVSYSIDRAGISVDAGGEFTSVAGMTVEQLAQLMWHELLSLIEFHDALEKAMANS